jgi:acetate kinase
MGLVVDAGLNAARSDTARLISPEYARVAVAVVPTDEELEIARQTFELVTGDVKKGVPDSPTA